MGSNSVCLWELICIMGNFCRVSQLSISRNTNSEVWRWTIAENATATTLWSLLEVPPAWSLSVNHQAQSLCKLIIQQALQNVTNMQQSSMSWAILSALAAISMAMALAAALHLLLLHCKLLRISRSLRTQRMKLVQLMGHTHHVTNLLPTCCAYKVWKKKFFEEEQSGNQDDDDHHYLAAHICSMKIPSTKSCNSKSETSWFITTIFPWKTSSDQHL